MGFWASPISFHLSRYGSKAGHKHACGWFHILEPKFRRFGEGQAAEGTAQKEVSSTALILVNQGDCSLWGNKRAGFPRRPPLFLQHPAHSPLVGPRIGNPVLGMARSSPTKGGEENDVGLGGAGTPTKIRVIFHLLFFSLFICFDPWSGVFVFSMATRSRDLLPHSPPWCWAETERLTMGVWAGLLRVGLPGS